MYGIMTDEIVKAVGLGDSDSRMMSFKVIIYMPLKLKSYYESPIVRCVALSRLVIRVNE